MNNETNYHEFSELPANWTQAQFEDKQLVNKADPYKWSGSKPPPAIGDEVNVYVNGIGPGVVTTYFAEYGFLGVKVRIIKPPQWYITQNGRNTAAHVFGSELEPF